MEETLLFSEYKLPLSSTGESFSIDESVWSLEAKSFRGGNSEIKEKKNKKKKKKCKGGPESPKRILAFNSSEWLKLDENKAESKKVKTLSKCATFPTHSPVSVEAACAGTENGEDSEDSEESDKQSLCVSPEGKTSMLMRCSSLPPKSALRGGYEELGLGPRPKLNVKWAPNVREPPSSSMSHTVNKHSKKKDFMHGRKGRSSHDDLYKKQQRRNSHKAKRNSDSGVFRTCGASYNGRPVKEGVKTEALILSEMVPGECEAMLSTESLEQKFTGHESDTASGNDVNYKLGSGKCFEIADAQSALLKSCVLDGFQYSNDAKCAGSLHTISGIQSKFVYGEAM